MNNLSKEIKHVLATELMKWNPLYEAKFNDKTILTPMYFGIYRNLKKPGYLNAERNFIKRLDSLLEQFDSIQLSSSITLKCLDKIRAFRASDLLVDFQSVAFKENCRTALLKPLRQLLRHLQAEDSDLLLELDRTKVLNKYYFQLNPFNYSQSYLTHFFYLTEHGTTKLLVDDTKRKAVRNLGGIFELTSFISRNETPRRKSKTALSYRYILLESNPGNDRNDSIVFCGGSFDTSAGGGVRERWIRNNSGNWEHNESFNHWRR